MTERLLTGRCWHVHPSPSWQLEPGGRRADVTLAFMGPPVGVCVGGGGFIEWNTSLELLSHPPTVYHGASSKCGGHKSCLSLSAGFTWVHDFTENPWFIANLSFVDLSWVLSLFATFCTSSGFPGNVSSVKSCCSFGDLYHFFCVNICMWHYYRCIYVLHRIELSGSR